MRKGRRGCRKPAGFSTNTPRSTKCDISSTLEPVPMKATGMRNSWHSSWISAAVCESSHGSTIERTSSRCITRPPIDWKRSSPDRSSRPIMAAKSSHCCAVNRHRPIQPSPQRATSG